jgi:hypothetical protein
VALLPDGSVAMRDSLDPAGGVLTLPPTGWRAFVSALRSDGLTG